MVLCSLKLVYEDTCFDAKSPVARNCLMKNALSKYLVAFVHTTKAIQLYQMSIAMKGRRIPEWKRGNIHKLRWINLTQGYRNRAGEAGGTGPPFFRKYHFSLFTIFH